MTIIIIIKKIKLEKSNFTEILILKEVGVIVRKSFKNKCFRQDFRKIINNNYKEIKIIQILNKNKNNPRIFKNLKILNKILMKLLPSVLFKVKLFYFILNKKNNNNLVVK